MKKIVISKLVLLGLSGCFYQEPTPSQKKELSAPRDSLRAYSLKEIGDSLLILGYQEKAGNQPKNSITLERALSCYDSSLMIVPQDVNALKGRADVLQFLGHLEDAVHGYQHAIAVAETLGVANNKDAAFLYNDLGTLYIRTQDYSQARRYFEKALQIDPEFGPAQRNLTRLTQNGY